MNNSVALLSVLDRIHAVGFKRAAALIANLLLDGRRFRIDADGDWLLIQPEATFASPRPLSVRYQLIERNVRDEWLYQWQPKLTDIVLDVGAGIGDEAVVLSPMVSRVVSIEAHPVTFRCLQKTISLSRLPNVTAIHCAVSDKEGVLTISDIDNDRGNDVIVGGSIEVPARTIASICAEHNIQRIDFLKMNIEGAEALALQGLGNVPVGRMAIGCHDFMGPQYATRERVSDIMLKRGYSITRRAENPAQETLHAV